MNLNENKLRMKKFKEKDLLPPKHGRQRSRTERFMNTMKDFDSPCNEQKKRPISGEISKESSASSRMKPIADPSIMLRDIRFSTFKSQFTHRVNPSVSSFQKLSDFSNNNIVKAKRKLAANHIKSIRLETEDSTVGLGDS